MYHHLRTLPHTSFGPAPVFVVCGCLDEAEGGGDQQSDHCMCFQFPSSPLLSSSPSLLRSSSLFPSPVLCPSICPVDLVFARLGLWLLKLMPKCQLYQRSPPPVFCTTFPDSTYCTYVRAHKQKLHKETFNMHCFSEKKCFFPFLDFSCFFSIPVGGAVNTVIMTSSLKYKLFLTFLFTLNPSIPLAFLNCFPTD